MKNRIATDHEWLQWVKIQKTLAARMQRRKPLEGIQILQRYLAGPLPEDLRREAKAFQGTLYEDAGDLASAKSAFLEAWKLAVGPTHVRFELEDSIALICKKSGDLEEASKWYSAALETAAADPRVAGGGFLRRFFNFKEKDGVDEREQLLVDQVIRQSWRLLRVEGEPDLSDVEDVLKKLLEAQARLFSAERPPEL